MISDRAAPDGNIDCDTCQMYLPNYVDLELSGEDAEERYPHVAYHIETCSKCEAAYYRAFRSRGLETPLPELQQVGLRTRSESTLDQILSATEPEERPAAHPDWVQVGLEYGRAWLERGTEQWRQIQVHLADLLSGPEAAPALAGLMGEETVLSADRRVQHIRPQGANFELDLSVQPDPVSEGLCQIEAAITLHDRLGDFSGVSVTLLWGDAVRRQTTDELGKARFTSLPCDQMPSMNLIVTLPD